MYQNKKSYPQVLFLFLIPHFLLLLHSVTLPAQTSQTLYFMEKVPQSGVLNPAYQHDHDFYIGIPMASSFNINSKSNFASYKDLIFRHSKYDSLISFIHPDADKGRFVSKLQNYNTFARDYYYGIISAGYRRNNSYFRIDVADRAAASIGFPKDLGVLALEGNEQFAGRNANISGFTGNLNYFREYALGYSYNINRWFNVGARAKLLFGKADLAFSLGQSTLYTDPETYNLRLTTEFSMEMSMPVRVGTDENGRIDHVISHFRHNDYGRRNFLFGARNPGVAFDVGGWFRVSPVATFFSSITDIGFIRWKRDVYNFSIDADYLYQGFDLSPLFDSGDGSDPVDNLLDTLKSFVNTGTGPYNRNLPSRLYFGGTYIHRNGLNIGLLSRFDLAGENRRRVITASLMKELNPWLTASFTYSFMNRYYNNPGSGLTARRGNVNLYFITDNVSSAIIPRRTRGMNMWFGCNLAFGYRSIRSEGRWAPGRQHFDYY
jgi:hypothetical protein